MVKIRSKIDPLTELLKKRQVVRTVDLLPVLKSYIQIKRKAEAGELVSLARGVYASPETDPFVGSVLAASRFYPKAVISNFTALMIHGLSDERIDKVDVDIPRERSIRNQMLKVHRVPKRRIIGIIGMPYHGNEIRIYDVERALCESFLIDPAGPLFFKALKRYIKNGKVRAEIINKYDAVLKTKVLMHLQQELADA